MYLLSWTDATLTIQMNLANVNLSPFDIKFAVVRHRGITIEFIHDGSNAAW